jgi:hypothetical protein
MEELAGIRRETFDARTAASVIFAPQLWNFDAITVTYGRHNPELTSGRQGLLSQTLRETITESIRQGISVVSTVLADQYAPFFSDTAMLVSATTSTGIPKSHAVQGRSFPFVRHLDLLASPVEGLIFDTEDNS